MNTPIDAVVTTAPVVEQERELRRRHLLHWLSWLVMLSLLIGVQALQLRASHQRIGQNQEARLRQQADLLSQALSRQFIAIDAGLRTVVADLPGWQARGDTVGPQARLKALDAAIAGTRTLAVIDEAGRIIVSSREGLVGADVTALAYFTHARDDNQAGRLYVSAPYRTRLGIWSLNLVRVLQHADGRFAGVVAATLDPEWLAVTVGSINYAADMWSGLTHTQGGLLFLAPAPRPGLEGENLARPGSMFSRHMASGQVETLFHGAIAVTGQGERVIVQRTVQPSGLQMDGSLVIGSSRSEDGMYATWYEKLTASLVLTALLIVLTAAGLALVQRAERRRAAAAHEAALALQASERRWLLALESSGLGVWEFDPRSGAAFQSPLWKRLLGYAETDLVPALDSWRDLLHPDDRESTLHRLDQHLQGEVPEYRAEFRLRCADGSWRWMQSSGRVVARDAQGRPSLVIGTMTDIQARREAEALRAENERIQATLTAKKAFLSQMNHEVRTPLNVLLGFAEILRQRLGQRQQPDLQPYVDHVVRAGRLLLDMMSDMLEYTRLDAETVVLNVQAVALPDVLQAALEGVAAAALKGSVTLKTLPCPAHARVLVDPDRLRRVLVSLLDNAITYNVQGGEVRIRCEPAPDGEPAWQLLIADTGCGMAPEELKRLFEPLYRGHHAGTEVMGAGLGLTLARWYLQRMGARLQVSSERGRGTEVTVTLPMAEG